MVINANQEINIPINEKLVCHFDIPESAQQNEAFLRWYLARVLTRGSADDLRDTGIKMISVYLPDLSLPRDIRAFWEWYLDLPAVKKRYGITDAITEAVA